MDLGRLKVSECSFTPIPRTFKLSSNMSFDNPFELLEFESLNFVFKDFKFVEKGRGKNVEGALELLNTVGKISRLLFCNFDNSEYLKGNFAISNSYYYELLSFEDEFVELLPLLNSISFLCNNYIG